VEKICARKFFFKFKKLWQLKENPEKFSGCARKIWKKKFKRDRDCYRKVSITGCESVEILIKV